MDGGEGLEANSCLLLLTQTNNTSAEAFRDSACQSESSRYMRGGWKKKEDIFLPFSVAGDLIEKCSCMRLHERFGSLWL